MERLNLHLHMQKIEVEIKKIGIQIFKVHDLHSPYIPCIMKYNTVLLPNSPNISISLLLQCYLKNDKISSYPNPSQKIH